MEPGRHAALRGVVFTDMVGSSELRSRLGDDRADALRRDHNALLGSAVTAHAGRVLRWTGDGIKADFPTASAALAAAIDMQRAVAAYGRRPDAVTPFQIRIGISVGEVVVEGNEAHGIAAIEAARLEPLAAPGEILATTLVRQLGQRRTDAGFEEVGEITLRGLDDPVTVVRVVDTLAAAAVRPLPRTLVLDRRFPLVGRAEEVGQGLACWQQARLGGAAMALVAGAPGLGKSRLVAQVADRAHTDGALVLAGSCDSDLAVPYQPFAQALQDAVDLDEDLAAAVAGGQGPLGRLFPTRRSDGVDESGPAARYELFEAVRSLVERLGRRQPLVLVLDDLQWAAGPTVQLLRHLLVPAPTTPLLILATRRPEEPGGDDPLRDLLADERVTAAVTRIDLGALAVDDLAELVAARVPFAPEPTIRAFADRLLTEGAGSPFFTCELLAHLTATGELERLVTEGEGAELPVPESVRAVVGQRLGRLPDDATAVLATAAVIGATFDLELLGAVAGRSELDVLEVCEDVAGADLVQEVDVGRFAFAHAIVRGTVLDSMGPTRRALGHRRVAEAIEELGRADHDELAYHWSAAGVVDRANHHQEQAGRRDLLALAHESAAERYQGLIEYHQGRPEADPAALARCWLGLGMARRGLGEVDFLDAIRQAGQIARRGHQADLLVDAAISSTWPGNFFIYAGQVPVDLVALAEDALAVVEPDDPRRVRVLLALAAHLTFDLDRDRRVALLAEALTIARDRDDPDLVASALIAEYLSLWDPTTAGRRAALAAEAARLAQDTGNADHGFLAGFLQVLSHTEHGRLTAVTAQLDALDEPLTAAQNFYYHFLVDRLRTSIAIFTGAPDAQDRVDALARRYEGTYADTAGTWAVQTGLLALQRGRLGDMATTIGAMIESSGLTANWSAPYGLALLLAGDRAGAAAVLAALPAPSLDYFWLTTLQITAELAIGLEAEDAVADCVEALGPHQDLLGVTASGTLCFGLVATTLGALALAQDRPDDAAALLAEAVDRAEAMGARFESVKARRLLATALLATGRRDEAHRLVGQAAADASREGFDGEAALLAALDGGVRSGP